MKSIFTIIIDPKRVFGLDILRALAIAFVVIPHGGYLLPSNWSRITIFFVFDGVSIFFVLSGFLIGGILIKIITTNGINKKILLDFWTRRWFRTLPNYFLILFLLCLLNAIFTDAFTFGSVYQYFIFSQNLVQGKLDFFPESWSLSIEEWFYLLVPVSIAVLTFIVKTTYKKGILITSLLLIFLVTFFRYYRYTTIPIDSLDEWDILYRKQVVTRLDSLMFGVIGAYICFFYSTFWSKYKKFFFVLGILLFLLSKFVIPEFTQINGLYSTVFSFTLISTATLLLLPYLSEVKAGKGFLYKSITYISLTSYSMYLLNLSIIQFWIIDKIPWNILSDNTRIITISKYGLYWVLLMSLSILLYKYFEIPMTAFRERKNIKLPLQNGSNN